jgi:hypothetical protein
MTTGLELADVADPRLGVFVFNAATVVSLAAPVGNGREEADTG